MSAEEEEDEEQGAGNQHHKGVSYKNFTGGSQHSGEPEVCDRTNQESDLMVSWV